MEKSFLIGWILLGGSFVFFIIWWLSQRKSPSVESEKESLPAVEIIFPQNREEEKKSKELEKITTGYLAKNSGDVFVYEGYREEIVKRFRANQVKKTAEAIGKAIEAIRKAWEERAGLYKAKAECKKAFYELGMVEKELSLKEKELEIKEKNLKVKDEMIDLGAQVKWLRLQKQKIELEKTIEAISKEEEKSQEEIFFQNLLDKIKELKMKQVGVDLMIKERDKMLSQIDRKKNPWFYQVVKNMWNNEIYKLRKKE